MIGHLPLMKSTFLLLSWTLLQGLTGVAFSQTAAIPAEKSWPQIVTLSDAPQIEVVSEDPVKKEFVYRSPHYTFVCDSRLRGDVVKEFGRVFEATYAMNCKLPLDLKPAPEPERTAFIALLFTNYSDYITAGGRPGSGGVYIPSRKALMVPLVSLGVKLSGSGQSVLLEKSSDDDNTTLIHEITHQVMNQWLGSMRVWQIEGSAEYISMLDYNRFGRFNLMGLSKQLKAYVQKMNPEGGGRSFVMCNLEELMIMELETWSAALSKTRGAASTNYGSAALLVYYYYHLDGSGDAANMIAFLRGLEAASSYEEEDALVRKHLLRNRTYAQLSEDVKTAFRREGIDITFQQTGKK